MKKLLNIIKVLIIFEVLITIASVIGSIIFSYSMLIPIIFMTSIIPILATLILYKAVKSHIFEKASESELKMHHQNCYNEFMVFYNRLKNYSFDEIEDLRKLLKKSKIIFWIVQIIIVLLFIIFCAYMIINGKELALYIWTFILAMLYTIFTIFYKYKIDKLQKEYNTSYKEKIMNLLIKNYNDKFEYEPVIENTSNREKYESLLEVYCNSKIIKPEAEYDTYIIEDYIFYKDQDYNMKLFDIYYAGGMVLNKANIFVEITAKTSLNNEMVLSTPNIEEDSYDFSQRLIKVKSDYEEFNKYCIYCRDWEKIKSILNEDILKELEIAYENCPKGFILRICKNKIYISFNIEKMFDDKLFSKFLDKNWLLEQYCLLDSIYKLADTITYTMKK